MKKIITGWIGQNRKLSEVLQYDYDYVDALKTTCRISKAKGKKSDWWPKSWPPKKIRITVEDI